MMNKRIIDAHSHIGRDSFHAFVGEINEYAEKASAIGITDSLVMPAPAPKININNEIINCLWKYNFSKQEFMFNFLGAEYSKNSKACFNPYTLANFMLKREILNYHSAIHFYFVPLVHPLFDSLEYIEKLLMEKPKAVKIHGIASGLSPEETSIEFFKLIKQYDIPLIVHTDYDSNQIVNPSSNAWALNYLRNVNTPSKWITFAIKMGIRIYLTHGVRLDHNSIHLVNTTDLFVVGIGPDSLISLEPDRLYYPSSDYLKVLCDSVSIDKLCFDLDYPWNVNKPISKLTDAKIDLDFGAIERLKSLGLTQNEMDKILWKNSAHFFNI